MNPLVKYILILSLPFLVSTPLQGAGFQQVARDQMWDVLTPEDWSDETSQSVPALTSPLNEEQQWESYNQWQCFKSQEVEILCVDVCHESESCLPDEWEKEALVSVLHQRRLIEFGVELPYVEKSCEETLSEWIQVMENQPEVCFFAALLQEEAEESSRDYDTRSFWVLDKIKTRAGYWSGNEFKEDFQKIDSSGFEVLKNRIIDGYEITISRDTNNFIQNLSISKNDSVVYSENSDAGEYYYFGGDSDSRDLLSGTDVTGNGIKDLIISRWTGGNHCCMQLYVFELGEQFKRVAKIDPYTMDIKLVDVDHDGVPEVEFYEDSIMGLFSCSADSRPGKVILKLDNGQYKLARNLMMKARPNRMAINRMIKNIRQSFQNRAGHDLTPEFLETMMNLSYSGNIDSAFEVAEEVWVDTKEDLRDFKAMFLAAMKESEYWTALYQK